MPVSVQLEPLLEQALVQAARRMGVTPSQFIVSAVQQALAQEKQNDPLPQPSGQLGALRWGTQAHSPTKLSIRSKLMAQRMAHQGDWLAYQEAKKQGHQWTPSELKDGVGETLDGMYDLVHTNKGAAP